ncbi:hypothetical protein [Flavisolibacter nicotianae]|uniref:hypothetical protein n=1 Tax=Flavisolibacter nicotianae TaxID=2364882 RepID=UPI000EB10168|nr:hypothetical protein [Flavisolibacter nicotianae]
MRTYFLLSTLLLSLVAGAQRSADAPVTGLAFLSSVGLGVIDNEFKPRISNSIQTSPGLEYRFSRQSSLTAAVNFDSYGYEITGSSYALNTSLKATGFVFAYRHRFGKANWLPYLKAGGGAVRLSVPNVAASPGFTRVENNVEVTGVVSAEAGIQWNAYRRYALFVGAEREWMGKSDLLNNSLRANFYKIGLISAF